MCVKRSGCMKTTSGKTWQRRLTKNPFLANEVWVHQTVKVVGGTWSR